MNTTDRDYPDEYRTGSVELFGREYRVTPDVLIPRLETEGLVRRARAILGEAPAIRVVDIGTGSGIIGTSIADLAERIIFLDVSREALEIAQGNFESNFPDKKSYFIVSDLLGNLPTVSLTSPSGEGSGVRYLFLANLPYIQDGDWVNMSTDTVYEPRLALFGGERTGFELYEQLFEEINQLNRNEYPSIRVLFEFGFDQRHIAEEILGKYPHWKYHFFADYAGIERFGEIIIE